MIPRIFIRKNDKTGQNSRKTEKSIFLIFQQKSRFFVRVHFQGIFGPLEKGSFLGHFWDFPLPPGLGEPPGSSENKGGVLFQLLAIFRIPIRNPRVGTPWLPPRGSFPRPDFWGFLGHFWSFFHEKQAKMVKKGNSAK